MIYRVFIAYIPYLSIHLCTFEYTFYVSLRLNVKCTLRTCIKSKKNRRKTMPKEEGLIPTCKYSYILFFCGKKRVYTENIFKNNCKVMYESLNKTSN